MRKLLIASLFALCGSAQAAPVVLDFEGVGNMTPVGNYYASKGVAFSPATLAIIDIDAGGSGNIANEPSGNTVMFFLDANNAILNFASGFTTGFSFFYSSSEAVSVNVYDGLNATGNLLGTLNLAAQYDYNCDGDPEGDFCHWTAVGVSFGGMAKSVDFGGTANRTGFDNITIGSAIADGGDVPEPGSLALMGMALAGLSVARRRS